MPRLRPQRKTHMRTIAGVACLFLTLAACGADGEGNGADGEGNGANGEGNGGEGNGANGEGDQGAPDQQAGADDCEPVSARASHHLSQASVAQQDLELLAQEASDRTEGRLEIDVFSDSQLGGLGEMPESLRSGAVEIAFVDSSSLSQFLPEIGVFSLPFMFDEMSDFNDIMDGALGETLDNDIRGSVGIEPLYWSALGLRDMFFVNEEVRSPDDMSGLTMRVPEASVWVDTFRALGSSPTAIPAGDLYTSLQTGVVDGFEFPLGAAVDLNLHEPVGVLTKTGHILTDVLTAASPDFLDGLCERDRQAFLEAADVARGEVRTLWVEDNEAAEAVLEDSLTVIHDADVQAFRDAVQPVHEDFQEQNGTDYYNEILEHLGR